MWLYAIQFPPFLQSLPLYFAIILQVRIIKQYTLARLEVETRNLFGIFQEDGGTLDAAKRCLLTHLYAG